MIITKKDTNRQTRINFAYECGSVTLNQRLTARQLTAVKKEVEQLVKDCNQQNTLLSNDSHLQAIMMQAFIVIMLDDLKLIEQKNITNKFADWLEYVRQLITAKQAM